MILLVFTASVVVAVILARQERRHRVEMSWEYERRGMAVPPARPKLRRTEAALNVGLGMLLVFFGTAMLVANLQAIERTGQSPGAAGQFPGSGVWEQAAFYWAGGLAMIVLGIRALMHIRRFERAEAAAG
jgi:hypothetical protein